MKQICYVRNQREQAVAIKSSAALTDMNTLVHNKYQIKLYQN